MAKGHLVYITNGREWHIYHQPRQGHWYAKPMRGGYWYKSGDITKDTVLELLQALDNVIVDRPRRNKRKEGVVQ